MPKSFKLFFLIPSKKSHFLADSAFSISIKHKKRTKIIINVQKNRRINNKNLAFRTSSNITSIILEPNTHMGY